jgi:hypothetical protein
LAGVGAITYSIGQVQLYWLLPLTLAVAGISLGMGHFHLIHQASQTWPPGIQHKTI